MITDNTKKKKPMRFRAWKFLNWCFPPRPLGRVYFFGNNIRKILRMTRPSQYLTLEEIVDIHLKEYEDVWRALADK